MALRRGKIKGIKIQYWGESFLGGKDKKTKKKNIEMRKKVKKGKHRNVRGVD